MLSGRVLLVTISLPGSGHDFMKYSLASVIFARISFFPGGFCAFADRVIATLSTKIQLTYYLNILAVRQVKGN